MPVRQWDHLRLRVAASGHGGSVARRLLQMLLLCAAAVMATAAGAAHAGPLKVYVPKDSPDTLVMTWNGAVAAPMAAEIRAAFEARSDAVRRIVFRINSGGGSVAEGERAIAALRDIRQTHTLETVVDAGDRCGSMCVFIYLQGQKRFAGLSSLWLFHEVSHNDPVTKKIVRLDRHSWERLVETYFGPAGVSPAWTQSMKPLTIRSDYWQTGADLLRDKSGIFHVGLGNQRDRLIADGDPTSPEKRVPLAPPGPPGAPSSPATPGTPPGAAPRETPRIALSWETKECREMDSKLGVYVTVACRN